MNRKSASIETILAEAVEIAAPDDRLAFIAQACGDDLEMRREVERMAAWHFEATQNFLEPAAQNIRPTVIGAGVAKVGTSIGPYKLLEQIGEGGMGVVYVAEQTEPIRRRVALKIIKPGMDSRQVVARFEAERQALALMDHPNIATVLDAGVSETGLPYFVMELVRGLPITEYCDAAKLTPDQRIELFIAVCQAVQHAHQKGIIHRDLKPSNVLVTQLDGKPIPKVIDFGVAKAVGPQLSNHTVYTGFMQLIGTPLYMSPEQAELSAADIDTRSDVYSLGVLLYELLTGRTPFDSETLVSKGLDEMRRIIREQEPPRPSHRISTLKAADVSTVSTHRGLDERRLQNELSGELDWIVMTALEKSRDRRYESASALAADLRRYLGDEPVLACPPSIMYRMQKSVRRHTGLLLSTVLVAMALLTGTGVSVRYAMVAEERRQDVEDKNRHLQAANEQLEDKNRVIAAAEAKATSNFGLAKRAVADLVGRVGREDLAAFPQLSELRKNLLTSARDFYSELIEANPRDHSLYIERGNIWRLLNDDQAALCDFHSALNLVPDDGDLLITIGKLHDYPNDFRLQDKKLAADYFRRGLEMNPESAESWSVVGNSGNFPGDPLRRAYEIEQDPAMKQFRLAEWLARVKKDFEGAVTASERALELTSLQDLRTTILLQRAKYFQKLGRNEEAIAQLTRGIQENAYEHHFYERRGSIYYNQDGKRELAIADFERAVELSQQSWWVRKRLAEWYFNQERWSDVLTQIDRALELQPRDLSTVTWISPERFAACGDQGLIDGYRRLADRAVELNNASPESLATRAEVCLALGDIQQAAADFDAVLAAPDAGVTVAYRAALFALTRDDRSQYGDICRRMLEMFGTSTTPDDNSFTAWTCSLAPKAIDDYATAVKLAEQAVAATTPAQRWDIGALGAILLRSGNAERALQVLADAAQQPASEKTSAAYVVYFEALALQQLGRSEEAAAKLKDANALADQELSQTDAPPAWNRRQTLELLRKETEAVVPVR